MHVSSSGMACFHCLLIAVGYVRKMKEAAKTQNMHTCPTVAFFTQGYKESPCIKINFIKISKSTCIEKF